MAVTTTKTNIMTIIEEDGGDPTGAGGKVINDNFKKIDDLFDGDVAQCSKFAPIASFAPVSSGVDYTVGTTPYPVVAWGSSFETKGSDNNGQVYLGKIAPLPAFGYYAYTVKLICTGGSDDYYLEYLIIGKGASIYAAKKIHDIDIDDSYSEVITSNTGSTSTTLLNDSYDAPDYISDGCWFATLNGYLCCGVFNGGGGLGSVVHATVYPSYVDRGSINSSSGDYIGDNANAVYYATITDVS